jgi:hypothetical protein
MDGETIAVVAAILALIVVFLLLGVSIYRKLRSAGEPHGRALAIATRRLMAFFLLHGITLLIGGSICWFSAHFLDPIDRHELEVAARIFLLGGLPFVFLPTLVFYLTRRFVRLSSSG